jgi:hypothetical protein
MKNWRPKWKTVTIALAAVVVFAMAAPALGGPSLKSLVKKEVKKQISKATGPAGPAGPAGANGANGANGVSGYQVLTDSAPYNTDNQKSTNVSCPAGKELLGGGTVVTRDGITTEVALFEDGPNPSGSTTTWLAAASEIPNTGSTGSWNMQTTIYCGNL